MIKPQLRKLTLGWGVNDADYVVFSKITKIKCPVYSVWHRMLYRALTSNGGYCKCYDSVSICDEWKYFSVFKGWVEKQPAWLGLSLDKDMLNSNIHTYSPETCIFIPKWLNVFIVNSTRSKTGLPMGVSFNKKPNQSKNPYWAQSGTMEDTTRNLGVSNTPEKAHKLWQENLLVAYEKAIDKYKNEEYIDSRVLEKLNMNIKRVEKDIESSVLTSVKYWSEPVYEPNVSQSAVLKKTEEK